MYSIYKWLQNGRDALIYLVVLLWLYGHNKRSLNYLSLVLFGLGDDAGESVFPVTSSSDTIRQFETCKTEFRKYSLYESVLIILEGTGEDLGRLGDGPPKI